MNPAYLDTHFLGSFNLETLPDHFFIITASNPMDVRLSDLKNEQRNKKLLVSIRESQCLVLPVTGASKDLTHQEQGFLVKTSKMQALIWGKEFKQRAIFEIRNDRLFILSCFVRCKDIYVGSFTDRWVGVNEEKMR